MLKIEEIVIAGGGPVGAYTSVLMSLLNLPVTVYEKRDSYTRDINVKITENFFAETQKLCQILSLDNSKYFTDLDKILKEKNNRILIRELEGIFKQQALSQGVKYINEEVNSFKELYQRHAVNNPIIIDCTGRNSKLRQNEFGKDEDNMLITPLESAMHVNFRAIFNSVNKSILYSSMKNNDNIRLTEIVASKTTPFSDQYKNVTIPVFISKNLADQFDQEYPNINKEPLKPFTSDTEIPRDIFDTIVSIIGPLIMEDWKIDFKSIVIKKIEITCGYSILRSRSRFICLGDSAVHLAFYKSLNFGLGHALEFFTMLSGFCGLKREEQFFKQNVIEEFKKKHPHLNPIDARQTVDANVYLIVTKIINYGVYKFSMVNLESEHLTSNIGVKEPEIEEILIEVNKRNGNWGYLMESFEAKRLRDIKYVIESNLRKKKMFDYLSDFIWLNGKSPIKISEVLAKISNGYALNADDSDLMQSCVLILRTFFIKENGSDNNISDEIVGLLELYSSKSRNTKSDFVESVKSLLESSKKELVFFKIIEHAREMIKQSDYLMNDGDVRFIFIFKVIEVIIDAIIENFKPINIID